MSDPSRPKRRPTAVPEGPASPPVLGEAQRARLQRVDGRAPVAAAAPALFWSGRRGDRVQMMIAGLLAFLLLGSMVALSVIGTGGGTPSQDGGADRAAPLVRDVDGQTVVALAAAGQGEQAQGVGTTQGTASGGSAGGGASSFTSTTGDVQFAAGVTSGIVGSDGGGGGSGGTGGAGQGQGQGGAVNQGGGQDGDQGGGQDAGGTGGDGGVVGGGDVQINGEPPAVEALGSEPIKPPKVKPPKVKLSKPEERGKPDKSGADVAGAGQGAGHSKGRGRGHEIGAGHGHDKHH